MSENFDQVPDLDDIFFENDKPDVDETLTGVGEGEFESDFIDQFHFINWRDIASQDTADQMWKLKAWVEWFVTRFRIRTKLVPDCWYQHPVMVEELTGLWLFWELAYQEEDPGSGPIYFLERLDTAKRRLEALVNCSTDAHMPDTQIVRKDQHANFVTLFGRSDY